MTEFFCLIQIRICRFGSEQSSTQVPVIEYLTDIGPVYRKCLLKAFTEVSVLTYDGNASLIPANLNVAAPDEFIINTLGKQDRFSLIIGRLLPIYLNKIIRISCPVKIKFDIFLFPGLIDISCNRFSVVIGCTYLITKLIIGALPVSS